MQRGWEEEKASKKQKREDLLSASLPAAPAASPADGPLPTPQNRPEPGWWAHGQPEPVWFLWGAV